MKHKHMTIIITLLVVNLALVWQVYANGTPDSPGPPETTTSYTLADLYNRLSAGITGGPSPFTEPTVGPGTGTMHSLNEIMAVAPTKDEVNGAIGAEVLSGKTFWGLNPASGQWGLQMGSLVKTAIPVESAVPKTGQTSCWDADGMSISCSGTGQDGAYQLGTNAVLAPSLAYNGAYLVPGWTGARFTDNGDGTVQDNLTGLVWLKNADCYDTRNWETALLLASILAHGSCGLSDGSNGGEWRLPNANELHSLIDPSQSNPALPADHPFVGVQSGSYYWSSTTVTSRPFYAFSIGLGVGHLLGAGKTGPSYVWPVRGGQ